TLALTFTLSLVFSTLTSGAQEGQQNNIRNLTQNDYQNMLETLGITAVRPGPSGNPKDFNAANSNEAKASPYSSLPNPLILNNGNPVQDAHTWWKLRRPEIVSYFDS